MKGDECVGASGHTKINRDEQEGAERVALVWRGQRLGHDGFRQLIHQKRAALAGLSLPPGRPVVVESNKAPGTIALIHALRQAGIPVLILPRGLGAEIRPEVAGRAGAGIELVDGAAGIERHELQIGDRVVPEAASRAAFILTTSGSTGVPKGVGLPELALTRFSAWARRTFDIGPGTRVLSYAPLNFDLSLLEVWATLDAGGTVVLVDPETAADPAALQRLVAEERPHLVEGVPLLYQQLVSAPTGILVDVRHLIVTGEATPQPLRAALARHCPGAAFHNIYGSTETNDSFVFSCGASEFASRVKLPIGQPIDDTEFRVVDEDGWDLTAAGEGELHTATAFAALGYTEAALTEAAFYRKTDADGVIHWFYRTGDMVNRDEDGALSLVGRRDHIVKVRGVRTNLKDVEQAIESHPEVVGVVACVVTEDDGVARIHAVLEASSMLSTLALRQHLSSRLPRTAIPSRFIVSTQPLPRTTTGKPDRKALIAALTHIGAS
jgi:acyl-coenzyme A synthetase/AMP-(fatty) acid ligase